MKAFPTFWDKFENPESNEEITQDPKDPTPPAPAETDPKNPEGGEEGDDTGAPEQGGQVEDDTLDPKPSEDSGDPVEFGETELESTLVLFEELGYEVPDDVETTEDGVKDFIAETVRAKVIKELSSAPSEVVELYQHLQAGKDFSEFVPNSVSNDWTKVDLESEATQERTLREHLILQGLDSEDIEEEVADVKEAGTLAKRASTAQKALIKKQEADEQARDQAKADREEEDRKAAAKEKDRISAKIDSMDKISDFELDKDMKSKFKDFIYKKNPRTGLSKMEENFQDEERRLKIAFLDFVDYSKDDIEKKATTKVASKRRKQIKERRSNLGTNSRRSVTPSKSVPLKRLNTHPMFGGGSRDLED